MQAVCKTTAKCATINRQQLNKATDLLIKRFLVKKKMLESDSYIQKPEAEPLLLLLSVTPIYGIHAITGKSVNVIIIIMKRQYT